MTEQNSELRMATNPKKRGRSPGSIPFPRDSLKDSLRIAVAIERDNAGQPYDPIYLASQSLKTTHRSSSFETLVRSAARYGLTVGNAQAKTISLTPLGSAIVAPRDESNIGNKIREALLTPELFKGVFERYDRKNFPRSEIVKNVLEKEFNAPRPDLDGCYEVISKNISDYNLTMPSGESKILMLDKLGSSTSVEETGVAAASDGLGSPKVEDQVHEIEEPKNERRFENRQIPKQIFVAHGKTKKPLEQLKRILEQFKVPFQVAIDEPHVGRAISSKVAQIMESCTSGIFIFTGDEEFTNPEGTSVSRPSENVIFELGAGTILFKGKIVIFREEGVSFGSDYTDYGHITFEKDKLDAKAFELMKELIGLGFLQVNPT
ncbi:MAG: TIR domain-containing protein [Nitrososphaerales archaeon]